MTCILNHNEKKNQTQNRRQGLIWGYEVNILFIIKSSIIWDTYVQQWF